MKLSRRSLFKILGAAAVARPDLRSVYGPQPLRWPDTEWLRPGEVFSIDGVYSVNPITGVSTGFKKYFTAGQQMIDRGPYRNVSALPAEGALIKLGWG